MKFDVIIGNPPYQEEAVGDNKTFSPPIYHKFMDESYEIANQVMFITPARFLFNAGATGKDWNEKMLSDEHLKVMYFESNSAKIFPNTDIKGGIAITLRDTNQKFGKIGTFSAYPELNLILKKVEKKTISTMDKIISGRGAFKLSEKALIDFPEIESIQSKGHKKDFGSGAFHLFDNLFLTKKKINDKQVKVLGLFNSKRDYRWIDKGYLEGPNSYPYYKIFIPQASGNGDFGEVMGQPVIGEPLVGSTETFLSIGGFETEHEANSALKYIKTKFCRTLLSVLKITQANTRRKWEKVPQQNFSKSSDIDWSKSIPEIDQQLYKKYNLSTDEIKFIEENVQEMN